jgi:hypothetical protein
MVKSGMPHSFYRFPTKLLICQSSRDQTAGNFGTTAPNTSTTSQSKPSLMDKLNPKVDANGDGKAGFMK